LEEALLAHEIDAAVHSLKDLPVITPAGLELTAILPRANTSDLLITLKPDGLLGLAPEAVLGTSSPRRLELLRAQRGDIKFTPIRGNVPTRLRKLSMNQRQHQLDGLVLARAGLERLGYDLNMIQEKGFLNFEGTELFIEELTWMLPAPGQGAIAVETRQEEGSNAAATYFAALHDQVTARCVTAERLLLHYLGGGCHMALGALATYDQATQNIQLKGIYTPSPGATLRSGEATASTPEEAALLVATQLGDKLAPL
jgi:hydroxymethylbilane synthase